MIPSESFQEVGQTMLTKSHSFTYYTFEYNVLEKQLIFLEKELSMVNTETNELNDIIRDLITKYNLNSRFSFFLSNLSGKSIFQIKKMITNFKTQLQNKEREKTMLLLDIETTKKQIIICNTNIKELYN